MSENAPREVPTLSASPAKRSVAFGRVALPGIGYKMGSRQMVATVMSPVNFIGTVGPRESWDPLSGTGTNRKEDKKHREGIAKYIEENEDYVLNALLVYMGPEDASFEPDDIDVPVGPGVLYVRPGAKFKVGDGGHRTSAYGDVIQAHQHGDEVLDRLTENGQPIIVVLDDDPVRRAQDFTDLQNNAKPLNASIAQSMDRRQAINRLLVERVIKPSAVPVVANNRIEFLVDSPGKLSSKVMGFKTLRYATGTLLIGTAHRTTRGWEDAVDLVLVGGEEAAYDKVIEFWTGFGQLPAVAEALTTEKGVVLLRENTWLTSASVIYAIAAAVYDVADDTGASVAEVMKHLADIDFRRAGTTLVGSLVDNETKKAVAGREAWESAASTIAGELKSKLR
jgi:DGQHR domain-containing protein